MAFSRGQTQVLYQFLPGAVFEHDQYGFCLITQVELRETVTNRGALFDAVADLLWQWTDESFRCLHREYNCPQFNRELSRAVLYGGPAPTADHGADLGLTVIRRGFWEDARQPPGQERV